jgi:hypothetical protein
VKCDSWHEQRGLPSRCCRGHTWERGQLTLSSAPCDCTTALARSARGHVLVHCHNLTCTETWQTDTGTLIEILEGRAGQPPDHDGAHAMAVLDATWTLLMQASEHQMTLLKTVHPSAACLTRLQGWVQDCVTAVDEAQQLGALVANGEAAHIDELAARVASLVDAFHLYASILGSFRNIHEGPQPAPLLATVDDERVLLKCRAELRKSIQNLISALQMGR